MIGLILGASCGFAVGIFTAALMRAADDHQVPTLGKGTWLISVDQWGDMVRCEPHACFEDAFRRLDKAMREGEA